jgi:hypothetical protein
MPPTRSALAVALALAFPLVLTACQDPSGVGLGLVGEEGGTPGSAVVAAASVSLGEAGEAATGGFGNPGATVLPQAHVLVGRVEDPLAGGAEATAYLDVRPPSTVPSGFRERTILTATLRLARTYLYGDTTSTLRLALAEVADNWSPVGAPADTGFVTGPVLTTLDVVASDTLVEIALPASWVTAREALLRSDSAASAFDGFQLRLDGPAPLPGAVLGFRTSEDDEVRSALRVTTSQDTVDYPVVEVFTALTRTAAAAPPPDRLLLRGGLNEAVALRFDVSGLDSLAVAGAALRVSADPTLTETPGFRRPLPDELALFGVRDDSSRAFLDRAPRDEDTNTYSFTSRSLTDAVQRAALGAPPFIRFEVGAPNSPLTLDVLPLVLGPPPGAPSDERRPRLVVTGVPTGN